MNNDEKIGKAVLIEHNSKTYAKSIPSFVISDKKNTYFVDVLTCISTGKVEFQILLRGLVVLTLNEATIRKFLAISNNKKPKEQENEH